MGRQLTAVDGDFSGYKGKIKPGNWDSATRCWLACDGRLLMAMLHPFWSLLLSPSMMGFTLRPTRTSLSPFRQRSPTSGRSLRRRWRLVTICALVPWTTPRLSAMVTGILMESLKEPDPFYTTRRFTSLPMVSRREQPRSCPLGLCLLLRCCREWLTLWYFAWIPSSLPYMTCSTVFFWPYLLLLDEIAGWLCLQLGAMVRARHVACFGCCRGSLSLLVAGPLLDVGLLSRPWLQPPPLVINMVLCSSFLHLCSVILGQSFDLDIRWLFSLCDVSSGTVFRLCSLEIDGFVAPRWFLWAGFWVAPAGALWGWGSLPPFSCCSPVC